MKDRQDRAGRRAERAEMIDGLEGRLEELSSPTCTEGETSDGLLHRSPTASICSPSAAGACTSAGQARPSGR